MLSMHTCTTQKYLYLIRKLRYRFFVFESGAYENGRRTGRHLYTRMGMCMWIEGFRGNETRIISEPSRTRNRKETKNLDETRAAGHEGNNAAQGHPPSEE